MADIPICLLRWWFTLINRYKDICSMAQTPGRLLTTESPGVYKQVLKVAQTSFSTFKRPCY